MGTKSAIIVSMRFLLAASALAFAAGEARAQYDPMFIHALFSHESGWMNEHARARNNPSGSLLSNRDGTRTHDVKPDMESALAAWEKRWGDRVRNAPSIQEFVEGLQQLRPGEPNPHRYNPDETRHNLKRPRTDSSGNRIPPYEDLVTAQIYSVIRHHNAWQNRRGKSQ